MNGFKEEKMSNTPEYELTFCTTSYDEYKKVYDFCQKLIDERENNNLCNTNYGVGYFKYGNQKTKERNSF